MPFKNNWWSKRDKELLEAALTGVSVHRGTRVYLVKSKDFPKIRLTLYEAPVIHVDPDMLARSIRQGVEDILRQNRQVFIHGFEAFYFTAPEGHQSVRWEFVYDAK